MTAQISTNLKNAAQTAKANGNGSLSSELTTLSNDFSSASSSGQLPNVQDLAKAMSGRHHGHGAPPASSSTASSVQANPATASLSSNIGLFQYLNSNSSLQQAAATSSQSLNPAGIIFSSLNNGTSAAAA